MDLYPVRVCNLNKNLRSEIVLNPPYFADIRSVHAFSMELLDLLNLPVPEPHVEFKSLFKD